jgi:hypothetical protein
VRYIDGLQVAVVQSDPIRESLGLSHCPHDEIFPHLREQFICEHIVI